MSRGAAAAPARPRAGQPGGAKGARPPPPPRPAAPDGVGSEQVGENFPEGRGLPRRGAIPPAPGGRGPGLSPPCPGSAAAPRPPPPGRPPPGDLGEAPGAGPARVSTRGRDAGPAPAMGGAGAGARRPRPGAPPPPSPGPARGRRAPRPRRHPPAARRQPPPRAGGAAARSPSPRPQRCRRPHPRGHGQAGGRGTPGAGRHETRRGKRPARPRQRPRVVGRRGTRLGPRALRSRREFPKVCLPPKAPLRYRLGMAWVARPGQLFLQPGKGPAAIREILGRSLCKCPCAPPPRLCRWREGGRKAFRQGSRAASVTELVETLISVPCSNYEMFPPTPHYFYAVEVIYLSPSHPAFCASAEAAERQELLRRYE